MAYYSSSSSRLLLQLQSSSQLMLRLSPFLASSPPSSSSLSFSANCHVSSSAQSTLQPAHQRSSEVVALEYADLNLSYNLDMGHLRIRQHVNPLSASFSVPAQVPDWNHVFADPMLPLMVDIGCGSGRFLMWLAKRTPKKRNFLGLEIRERIVKRAETWAKDLALNNIHFMFANATISFKQLVESYPGPLVLVSILCPDPHFKKRHHKRRVIQKPLVGAIVDNLMPGGQVFVQSDVLQVALDMRNQFDEVEELKHIDVSNPAMLCDSEGWLLSNPMGIRTEREIHAELEGAKIFRRLYQKQI
ncbi:tRNA (guanine-N(7)-)-methyltransferase [Vigna umbellata]|uniref:tRNA (guanine-N(7)-)-methyltransferase n=1 Tax=Vigna umbellata TaxID=87088 RepID=UPI001F5FBA08|nr:tRNA (guanine-N(7)-)-methyltransferase [Vigna umbellata]